MALFCDDKLFWYQNSMRPTLDEILTDLEVDGTKEAEKTFYLICEFFGIKISKQPIKKARWKKRRK